MRSSFRTRLGNSLVLMALAASSASAQTSYHVARSRIQTGLWTLAPIYVAQNGVPGEVHSFLALADGATLTGENLGAVWYVRDADGWHSMSWNTSNPLTAIASVKATLGIPDSEDDRWGLVVGNPGTPIVEQPATYAGGVMAEDPLADLVAAAPDHDALVAFLTGSGLAAANIPVDQTDECSADDKLNAAATYAVSMIASGDETVMTVSATALCAMAGAPPMGPAPVKPAKPTTAPPWTPPGTVPSAPGWVPGGWPVGPAPALTPLWKCTSTPTAGGGNSCSCKHSQQWGEWQTNTCGIWPFNYPCIE